MAHKGIMAGQNHELFEKKSYQHMKNKQNNGDDLDTRLENEFLKLLHKNYNNIQDLSKKDIKIITFMFKRFLDDSNGISTINLLKLIHDGSEPFPDEVKRIEQLKEYGILEFGYRSTLYKHGGADIMRSSFLLSGEFINNVCNLNDKETLTPYLYNKDYLNDKFRYIKTLKELRNSEFMHASVDKRNDLSAKLEAIEIEINNKLALTNIKIPLEVLKEKESLNKEEELTIIYLLHNSFTSYLDEERGVVLTVISKSPYDYGINKKLFEPKSRLIKNGLIVMGKPSKHGNTGIAISDNLKEELIDEKIDLEAHPEGYGLLEISEPTISLDEVILRPSAQELIETAVNKFSKNTSQTLRKWGIKDNITSYKNQTLTMILYGESGTGKTIAANGIAYELGRKIVTLDCSNILGKWVGDSEKNTRQLFDQYYEISKTCKNPPVMLLNEADQFLHNRISATRSTDHMYNQMQNIFLEQLEKFDGILIATTNLLSNIDSAFSRRFHYKIEIKRPGPDERYRLWQAHIPNKAPLASDIDLKHLVENYDLSGGQISVVINHAATRAALRGDHICQTDFISACKAEMIGNFDDNVKQRAGF